MAPSALLCGALVAPPVRRCRVAPAASCAAASRAAGRRASGPHACTCSLAGGGGEVRRAASRPPAAIASPPASAAAPSPVPAASAAAPDALPVVLPEDLVVAPGVVVPVLRDNTAPACDFNGYLRRILTARVYELAVRAAAPNPRSGDTRAWRLTRPRAACAGGDAAGARAAAERAAGPRQRRAAQAGGHAARVFLQGALPPLCT